MKTILLSYNEVQSIARKAARGAGFPHGAADDIGQAAVWLSARGVDAISVVVGTLAVQGVSVVLDGFAAIDALCCGERDDVPLLGGAESLLLLGFAGAAARETGLRLSLDFGGGDSLSLTRLRDAAQLAPATLRLMPGCEDLDGDVARRPAAIDAEAYAAALVLAAKTYVPASDLSRTRGAGAGTTDND